MQSRVPNGGAAQRQVMNGLEIESKQAVELVERKVMNMSLFSGKSFPAENFPAAMQMVVERHGADVRAA